MKSAVNNLKKQFSSIERTQVHKIYCMNVYFGLTRNLSTRFYIASEFTYSSYLLKNTVSAYLGFHTTHAVREVTANDEEFALYVELYLIYILGVCISTTTVTNKVYDQSYILIKSIKYERYSVQVIGA